MDFLQQAISAFEASQTMRSEELGISDELRRDASYFATLSIAHSLQRIADRLELMTETGTGYSGEDIAALRVSNLT